jgi:hypothetical protein
MTSLVILFAAIVTIGSFIDSLVQPSTAYAKAGKSKALWAFLIFFFGIFAAVPYLVAIRPMVVAAK